MSTTANTNNNLDDKRMKKKAKTVQFDTLSKVYFIENSQDFSMQEIHDTWYTSDDLRRLKRISQRLSIEYLNVYSEDELFDRFGIQSAEERGEARKRMKCAVHYIVKHLKTKQVLDVTDNKYFVVGVNCPAEEAYSKISTACIESAMDRALRIERQVHHSPSDVSHHARTMVEV